MGLANLLSVHCRVGSSEGRQNGGNHGQPVHCRVGSSEDVVEHGVRRRNFRLEAMLGSWVKQRIETAAPIASQPMRSTSASSICARVMPWRGLRGWGRVIASGFGVSSVDTDIQSMDTPVDTLLQKRKRPLRKVAHLFESYGSPTWDRTRDLRINSPTLYR